MGERLHALDQVDTISRPAYYSKTKLKSGVGRIDNEIEIEEALATRGVDIIYPETLSLEEQVREMAKRRYVLGSAGSFLHTSIFCPPRNITCLNVTSQINSNFSLIDRLAGNAAGYYYPPAMQVLGQSSTFLTARHLIDAPIVAHELLDIALAG
jgi:capsular polysaccharide biosynthesis protein